LNKNTLKPAKKERIKIVLADDHKLFRDGLASLLNLYQDLQVVGIASNGKEALELANKLSPEVLLLDISMPVMNGIPVIEKIKKDNPGIIVLVLSAFNYDNFVLSAIEKGADGYLIKDMSADELHNAILVAKSGDSVYSVRATSGALHKVLKAWRKEEWQFGLKKRELEVLHLAARGLSNKEIAETLCISMNTVGTHFVHIFRKMGARSRTEAILRAIKSGSISIEDLIENSNVG